MRTSGLKWFWMAVMICVPVVTAGNLNAGVVYSNNFDTAAFVASGVTASGFSNLSTGTANGSYNGANGKVWGNSFGRNASSGNPATASTLTLSNLGAHSSISIDFMLGFLDSWDSTNGSVSPDYLDFYIDGNLVAKLTSAIASGGFTNYGGGTLLVDNGQIDTNFFFSDDLVDMNTAGFLTFAHSSSTLTLTIQASGAGWQGGGDESWGIDDLTIQTFGAPAAVPEPGSIALWGASAIGGILIRRRRRSIGFQNSAT